MINCQCIPKVAIIIKSGGNKYMTTAGMLCLNEDIEVKHLCIPKFSFLTLHFGISRSMSISFQYEGRDYNLKDCSSCLAHIIEFTSQQLTKPLFVEFKDPANPIQSNPILLSIKFRNMHLSQCSVYFEDRRNAHHNKTSSTIFLLVFLSSHPPFSLLCHDPRHFPGRTSRG
jgi:hypothetical protein